MPTPRRKQPLLMDDRRRYAISGSVTGPELVAVTEFLLKTAGFRTPSQGIRTIVFACMKSEAVHTAVQEAVRRGLVAA